MSVEANAQDSAEYQQPTLDDALTEQEHDQQLNEIQNAKSARTDEHEAFLTDQLVATAGGELDEDLAKDVRAEAERQADAEFTPKNLQKAAKAMDKAERRQTKADEKAARKAEKGPNYFDKLHELDAARDEAMKEGFAKVDESIEKIKEHSPDVIAADPELATKGKYQVQREVQAEFSRENLSKLNPTERFTKIRSAAEAVKKAYVERRQQRLEPTAEGRTKLLEKFGVDESTLESIKTIVEKADTYDERMDRTVEQKRKYLNDLTRKVALKGFDVGKLAESEEAKDALNYFRLMVDFVRTDTSQVETQPVVDESEAENAAAAEIDAKLIAMNPQIEAEIEQTTIENRSFSERARSFIGSLREKLGRKAAVSETESDEDGAEIINLDEHRERRKVRAVGAAALLVFSLGVGSAVAKTSGGVEAVAYANAPVSTSTTEVVASGVDLGIPVDAPSDEVVASAASVATEAEASAEQSNATYTVQEGDSIWNIAKSRVGENASNQDIANEMARIIDLNQENLPDPDEIRPNQVLKT